MPKPAGTDLAAEREKVRVELARANELVAQVKTEVRVLESRRGEIREGIEAQSNQLKLEREQELDDLVSQAEAALEPLRKQRTELQHEVSSLSRDLQKYEAEKVGVETEIMAARQTLGLINREVETGQKEASSAELQRVNITAQITKLTSQIQPLREELAHLTDDMAGLDARKTDAAWELTALQAEYNSKKVLISREIDGLEHKRRDLAGNLNIEAKNMATAREALANWESNLEKRDKILRVREMKVATDEQKLADNVGLLNL